MRANGYKCYQTKCGACEGNVCGEPFDIALGCDARMVKPQTNADRIRAMSDEELAEYIHAVSLGWKEWCDYHCENECDDGCDNCILDWLKQPVKDGEDDG